MNYFIDVVLQEARLLYLNINLFIEKKKRKEDKNKKHVKNYVTLRSFDKNETLGVLYNQGIYKKRNETQSGCSLKKKCLHFDFISDFPIFLPKSGCSLKKKGPQSESFSEENVAANNFHTAIIVRKAVSTTTFACFRGARAPRRTVWEPLL